MRVRPDHSCISEYDAAQIEGERWYAANMGIESGKYATSLATCTDAEIRAALERAAGGEA